MFVCYCAKEMKFKDSEVFEIWRKKVRIFFWHFVFLHYNACDVIPLFSKKRDRNSHDGRLPWTKYFWWRPNQRFSFFLLIRRELSLNL